MLGLNSIPILFRFSRARDLENLENPESLTSSKHPLTVKVSKPNVLLIKKFRDSECILISAFA